MTAKTISGSDDDRAIRVRVKPDESYAVRMISNIFELTNKLLADQISVGKALVVIDAGLPKPVLKRIRQYMAHHRIQAAFTIVPGGETVKEGRTYVDQVLEAADEFHLDRKQIVIAVGGGAVLDMAGYAAGTYHRGIDLIRIPTTLLSQIDAGIGVKNAVNLFGKKNFAGVFQPPMLVLVDPHLLATLDDGQMRSGIAEAIKISLMRDPALFELIEAHHKEVAKKDLSPKSKMLEIMWRTITAHLDQITIDPYEKELARPLDFGHAWGHRLESVTNYRILHGEGVAIGMAIDTVISWKRSYITDEITERILRLIEAVGLPLNDETATVEHLWEGLDYFRIHLGGQLTIPLLKGIGTVYDVHDISKWELEQALAYLKARRQPTCSEMTKRITSIKPKDI